MCAFAKDALSFWKKYKARALVVDKISVITLLEGFRGLIGQSPPPIWLQINHSARWPNLHLTTPWTQISRFLNCFRHWKNYKKTRLSVWIVWKLSSFWMRENYYTCQYWHCSITFLKKVFHKPFPLGWSTCFLKGAMLPNSTTTGG
jgi:hypothetical protein